MKAVIFVGGLGTKLSWKFYLKPKPWPATDSLIWFETPTKKATNCTTNFKKSCVSSLFYYYTKMKDVALNRQKN